MIRQVINKTLCAGFFVATTLVASMPMAFAGADPFIGEITWVPYNFAPQGYAFCDGQVLDVDSNTALASILGNTYGGDGVTTFALPNVMDRIVIGAGQGAGLTDRALGDQGGARSVQLSQAQMPSHRHNVATNSGAANSSDPTGRVLGSTGTNIYQTLPNNLVSLSPEAIGVTGKDLPIENRMPFLRLHCVIATQGIDPQRQ